MSDFKSKLPDFKELTSMTGKLYKGIKNSVQEIIRDYKEKRAETETKPAEENELPEKSEGKTKTSPAALKKNPPLPQEDNKEEA